MKAQVLYKKKDIRLEEKPVPSIKDNEVLIQIKVCGVCKSDIDYYFSGRVSDFIVEKPIIIGHEASGFIEDVGKNVKNLKKGDKVSIIPLIGCKECEFCMSGKENLCRNRKFLGCPPDTQGCFQQYLVHPAELVIKINDDIALEEAAIIEPSAIAYNSIKTIGGIEGKNIVGIIGAGTIGVLIGNLLSLNNDNTIYFFDLDKKKLSFATNRIKNSFGILVSENGKKFKKGLDLNMAFEVSGSSTGVNIAIENMDFNGKIALTGWSPGLRLTNLNNVVLKEILLKGSSNFTINDFRKIGSMLNEGKLSFKGLYQNGFLLDDIKKVFERFNNRGFEKPKILIKL